MRIEIFVWSCFVNVVLSAAMAIFVLFSRPLTKVKILWAAMCFSVSIWSIGIGTMSLTGNKEISVVGNQILYVAAPFIPVFLLHTTLALLRRNSKLLLSLVYISAFVLVALNFLGHLSSVAPVLDFKFYTTAGRAYPMFVLHLYGIFILNGVILWKASNQAPYPVKRQLRFLFFGTTLGFIGGQTTIPLVYGVPLFPYGNLFCPLYIFLVGYGMLKYQLMDARVAFRKLTIAAGIMTALTIILLPLLWPSLKALSGISREMLPHLVITAASLAIVMAAGPVIYALITQRGFWLRAQSAAGLTHELRSPLSGIDSAAEILAGTAQTADYAAMIRRNVQRLDRLVTDLLQLAQLQEESHELDRVPNDLCATVRQACDQHRDSASEKGLFLEEKLLADEAIGFFDKDKIHLVISNLLSNAIKFSDQGTITVSVHCQEKEMICTVSDQGKGISSQDLPHIFERFYQGKGTAKGSGLGLAIAKGWVEAHGGKIWGESEGEGKGTKISFIIQKF